MPHRLLLASATALTMLGAAAVLAAAAAPVAGTAGERFRVSAEIHPQARSTDGRFVLSASVRMAAVLHSRDSRFALKAANLPEAGCEPFADGVFANGFEVP